MPRRVSPHSAYAMASHDDQGNIPPRSSSHGISSAVDTGMTEQAASSSNASNLSSGRPPSLPVIPPLGDTHNYFYTSIDRYLMPPPDRGLNRSRVDFPLTARVSYVRTSSLRNVDVDDTDDDRDGTLVTGGNSLTPLASYIASTATRRSNDGNPSGAAASAAPSQRPGTPHPSELIAPRFTYRRRFNSPYTRRRSGAHGPVGHSASWRSRDLQGGLRGDSLSDSFFNTARQAPSDRGSRITRRGDIPATMAISSRKEMELSEWIDEADGARQTLNKTVETYERSLSEYKGARERHERRGYSPSSFSQTRADRNTDFFSSMDPHKLSVENAYEHLQDLVKDAKDNLRSIKSVASGTTTTPNPRFEVKTENFVNEEHRERGKRTKKQAREMTGMEIDNPHELLFEGEKMATPTAVYSVEK
ncbi:hypothetical protein IAU59_006031 [Kwoniella sp. CBS 9459]